MRRRVLGWATGLLLTASLGCISSQGAQTGRSEMARRQSVALDLRVDYAGNVALHAFSFGEPYSVDSKALSFSARRLGESRGTRLPLEVTVGAVQAGQQWKQGQLQEFVMPMTFGKAPADGGFWNMQTRAAKEFATTSDGVSLPLGDWTRPTDHWHMVVWWPSKRDIDQLSKLRDVYVGRDLYAYGSSTLRCAGNVATFDASTPLRVVESNASGTASRCFGPARKAATT